MIINILYLLTIIFITWFIINHGKETWNGIFGSEELPEYEEFKELK